MNKRELKKWGGDCNENKNFILKKYEGGGHWLKMSNNLIKGIY